MMLFVFTILKSIWSFCQLKQEYNRIDNDSAESLDEPETKAPLAIHISSEQSKNGYTCIDPKNDKKLNVEGRSLYSEEINKRLIETQYEIEYDKKAGKKVRKRICSQKNKAFKILSYHKGISNAKNKNFFNESKLCLTDDIEKHNSKICCHRGCYYDAFLTNICCTMQYYTANDLKLFFDGYDELFLINKNNTIISISGSNMDNQIGISTIGLTTDNYIVIWIQNGHNQRENLKASPSGSGSCDWADIKHVHTFNEIIEYAMQRELWEESGGTEVCKKAEQIGKTKLIGYFRLIEKGGKPEFLGVTQINFERRNLIANTDEVIDPGFKELHFDNHKETIGIIRKKRGGCNGYKIS